MTEEQAKAIAAPPVAISEREALTKADMIELYHIAREKPKGEWLQIVRAALAANLETPGAESPASTNRLTDEQILQIWHSIPDQGMPFAETLTFARAIIAATEGK